MHRANRGCINLTARREQSPECPKTARSQIVRRGSVSDHLANEVAQLRGSTYARYNLQAMLDARQDAPKNYLFLPLGLLILCVLLRKVHFRLRLLLRVPPASSSFGFVIGSPSRVNRLMRESHPTSNHVADAIGNMQEGHRI